MSGCDKERFRYGVSGLAGRCRKYYRLNACGAGPAWRMPNNDVHSVVHAVVERVIFVKDQHGSLVRPPKPWDEDGLTKRESCERVRDDMQPFIDALKNLLTKTPAISTDEFLMLYGGSKRKRYEAAAKTLDDKGYIKKMGRVKTFTKDEYMKTGKPPRAIQPRSPEYNVCLGRYIKAKEHEIFEAIDQVSDPTGRSRTVAKGMNMKQRGQAIADMWEHYENPVAIGLDASRFDAHINIALLQIEHELYEHMNGGKDGDDTLPDLMRLLVQQLLNEGEAYCPDGWVKYVVEGARCSGDMNTSLGNVIIMCMLMYMFKKHKGVTISLLNDGDDCVCIMDRKDLAHFSKGLHAWFLRYGIDMTTDGVYTSLEQVEFCQARPVELSSGWTLVPRVTKRLYSDLITTKNVTSAKVFRKQVGAIAGCGMAWAGDVPVFNAFYDWMGRAAVPWVPEEGDYYHKFRDCLMKGMAKRRVEPTPESRASFYAAFDITPEEQIALEEHYDTAPLMPDHSAGFQREESAHCSLPAVFELAPPEQVD